MNIVCVYSLGMKTFFESLLTWNILNTQLLPFPDIHLEVKVYFYYMTSVAKWPNFSNALVLSFEMWEE